MTNPTVTKAEDFKIKNLRIATGQDCPRFSVSLYFQGKRAAIVSNGGTGGCHNWQWLDRDVEQSFNAMLKTLTFEFAFEQSDEFLDGLIVKQEQIDWLKTQCRKETLFLLVGEDSKESGYRTVKNPFNPAVKTFLTKKYGDQLQEIVNEQFVRNK